MEISSLPEDDGLKTVQESIKERGRIKTLLDQLQSRWFNLLVLIFLIASSISNETRFRSVEKNMNIITNQTQITIPLDSPKDTQTKTQQNQVTLGSTTEFKPEDWIIENFTVDQEGYYCPSAKGFQYWSMWSKKKLPPSFSSLKIRLRSRTKTKTSTPPTIVITYGDYQGNNTKSPLIYYWLSIFDEDVRTLRLYNEENKGLAQDWLKSDPNLNNEMTITLAPRIPDPSGRKLNINPILNYNPINSENPIEFKPDKEFATLLPTVDLEDKTIKKQIGIGTRNGACIKIESVEFPISN